MKPKNKSKAVIDKYRRLFGMKKVRFMIFSVVLLILLVSTGCDVPCIPGISLF